MLYPPFFPNKIQTFLLCAALLDNKEVETAWEEFQKRGGNLEQYIKKDHAVKRLLPLLYFSLQKENVVIDKELATILKSAYVWEIARCQYYSPICFAIIHFLQKNHYDFIVLKGLSIAHTSYPELGQRHSHDMDILIRQEQFCEIIVKVKKELPFFEKRDILNTENSVSLTHQETKFPITFHYDLYYLEHYTIPQPTIWQETTKWQWSKEFVCILTPEIQLLHICVHASYNTKRQWSSFICDSWFLLQKFQCLDWDKLLRLTTESNAVIPLYNMLLYLQQELKISVPEVFWLQLSRAKISSNARNNNIAFFFQQQNLTNYSKAFIAMNWSLKKMIFSLCIPSTILIKREYCNIYKTKILLPFFYLSYQFKYVSRVMLFFAKHFYLLILNSRK